MGASCIYSIFILNSSLLTPFSDQWSQEVEAENNQKLSSMCTSITKVFLVDVYLFTKIHICCPQSVPKYLTYMWLSWALLYHILSLIDLPIDWFELV